MALGREASEARTSARIVTATIETRLLRAASV
jgi:hypothetical protein